MVIRATLDYSVGTAVAFLFRKGNFTSNLRLNCNMGLELIGISLVGTIVTVMVLVVTLNKSKQDPNLIRRLPVRLA